MPTPPPRVPRPSAASDDPEFEATAPLAGEAHVGVTGEAHLGSGPVLPNLSLGGLVDPKRILWLGGLAALGVIGVLEWPVVAAVGVGSYVAERFAKDDVRQNSPRP